jgi:hypothetical protein
MHDVRTLGEWLQARGLEPQGLVASTGLEPRVIEALVAGRYTPSPQQRQRVAAALLVDPAQIAWGHAAAVEHMYGHGPQFGRSP